LFSFRRIHVDEAVLDKGVKMVEAATKKCPTAYTDLRKLLEDKSIDAISIATPNHQHTLQTTRTFSVFTISRATKPGMAA